MQDTEIVEQSKAKIIIFYLHYELSQLIMVY